MYQDLKQLSNKQLKDELKQYTIFIFKNREWTYNFNSYHNKDYLRKLETEFYIRSIK
jgi:hypothetical protein